MVIFHNGSGKYGYYGTHLTTSISFNSVVSVDPPYALALILKLSLYGFGFICTSLAGNYESFISYFWSINMISYDVIMQYMLEVVNLLK